MRPTLPLADINKSYANVNKIDGKILPLANLYSCRTETENKLS